MQASRSSWRKLAVSFDSGIDSVLSMADTGIGVGPNRSTRRLVLADFPENLQELFRQGLVYNILVKKGELLLEPAVHGCIAARRPRLRARRGGLGPIGPSLSVCHHTTCTSQCQNPQSFTLSFLTRASNPSSPLRCDAREIPGTAGTGRLAQAKEAWRTRAEALRPASVPAFGGDRHAASSAGRR